jgi:Predicted membrane protein (DUF2243)
MAPLAPEAQPPTHVHRIGALSGFGTTPGRDPFVEAFLEGMRALGYVEGQSLVLAAERCICPRRDSFSPGIYGPADPGWGVVNLVEGVMDHQILGIHNVREVSNATVYNLTFLAVGGVLFILLGWQLMRAGRRAGVAAQG